MWPFRERARGAGPAPALLPPAAAGYTVVDTELTGLDERRDSIVSLGGLRMAAGRIDLAQSFYTEVRPASAFSAQSIVLHGITPEDVRHRPTIDAVLADFADFCGEDILVGHFVEIDLAFLRREAARAGRGGFANPALDTWLLYDWMASRAPERGVGLPRLQDPRLPELARALGVPRLAGHNALADAFVAAQVFQRLLRRLERWGITTTGQLLRVADPARAPARRGEGSVPLA